MYRLLSLLAILALTLFSVPLVAQQDTSMAGREREGIAPPQGQQQGQAEYQPQDTSKVLTTRQGTEQDTTAGPAGEAQRAAQEQKTETTQPGAEMPTTASPLPWIGVAGALLIAFGLGMRYLRGRS